MNLVAVGKALSAQGQRRADDSLAAIAAHDGQRPEFFDAACRVPSAGPIIFV